MRAWHCHGRNQRDLVDRLAQAGIAKSDSVKEVLRLVDRRYYVHEASDELAYMDAPQSIGLGQTISAPHMHAHVLEEILPVLQRQPEPLALLDVGCGSGYLTACFGRWVQARPSESSSIGATAGSIPSGPLGKTGKVYGIDIYPHLVDLTRQNMKKNDADLLTSHTVSLSHANGWNGLPNAAPFDAIHVGAAAANFPRQLALQLKVGGVLIVPVGPTGGTQYLYRVDRIGQSSTNAREFVDSDYRITELLGVRYVPLVEGP
jgi:protein-L-isoaspartate(D-aspartate) O-methyltransferase